MIISPTKKIVKPPVFWFGVKGSVSYSFPHHKVLALKTEKIFKMKVLYILISIIFFTSSCFCGEHPDGVSKVSRTQDALGNYHFSYNVANAEGEQFREEGTDSLGRVVGSYGLKHSDGTHRVVDYVADQDGFRASIRTNEPGLVSAEAADASIVKTDHNVPLILAASSDDESRQVFGRRLDPEVSKVEYVEDKVAKENEEADESARESRQRIFDDYRPLHPVAYYPGDSRSPPNLEAPKPIDPVRTPRLLQNPRVDSKPLDVYFPPIDPHTAVRRPTEYIPPRDRVMGGNFIPTTTSRKPYVPPYGGFDDDPVLPVDRHPVEPDYSFSTPRPLSSFGGRKFPPVSSPDRGFNIQRFPQNPGYHRSPSGNFPPVSRDAPQAPPFNPPTYNGRIVPKFVLKAVPISNGIQAVRVDPDTGRVYERLVYPLFLRHDGSPEYDRNILLHNDDVSDDDAVRHDDPGYLDMPYLRRPYRGARDEPSDNYDEDRFRNGYFNRSHNIDEHSLSVPSAADFSWIKKQLDLVEGFNREHFSNGLSPNRFLHRDPNLPDDDPFDEDDRQQFRNRNPLSRIRTGSDLSRYSSEDAFSRDSRTPDELTPESSKKVELKTEEEANSKREEIAKTESEPQ